MNIKKLEVMIDYDEKSASYDELYGREQSAKFEAFLDQIKLKPDNAILDVGCGTGLLIERLAGKVGVTIGVDFSKEMLSIAKEKLRGFERNFLILADADHLPLKQRIFTHTFAVTLLQNMPDPKLTIQELKRVMKQGSILVLTGLKKEFTAESFRSLIEKSGLKLIDFEDREDVKDYIAVCSFGEARTFEERTTFRTSCKS